MSNNASLAVNRRQFLFMSSLAGITLAAPPGDEPARVQSGVAPIALPPLPYAQDALAPVISEQTLSFHYGKHHLAYVNNTIKLIAGTGLEKQPLDEIIRKTSGKPEQAGIFNNAAQVFNHTFYWHSMKPGGGGEPKGVIADRIGKSFGSYQKFVEAFSGAAAQQFGSGWAWLVDDGGKLGVIRTPNAETPLTMSLRPLVTIDVWEHAYYLDFQNRRPDYIKAFVEKLLNWDFAEKNLS